MQAKRLFDSIEIPIVFMEWGYFPKQIQKYPNNEVENMIDFLLSYKLKPYVNGKLLEKQDWKNWPWDIYWMKDGWKDTTFEKTNKILAKAEKKVTSFSSVSCVKVFDLNKPLEPITEYTPIDCRSSQIFFQVATTLCVHDFKNDIISGLIWRDGIWDIKFDIHSK